MPDDLQQLQLDVTSRLTADSRFQYVQVINSRPRSAEDAVMIQGKIDNALAGLSLYLARTAGQTDEQWEAACAASGKSGLCLTVLMPELELPSPGMAGPALVEVVLTVRVTENPMINMGDGGTLITAEDAAVKVLQALHHWSPNGAQCFIGDKKPVRPLEGGMNVLYDVVVRMPLGLGIPASAQPPKITEAATGFTATCATSGAAIWYTLDGTLPTPANGLLYPESADEQITALVRAVAYASGLASSVAQKQISQVFP